MKVREIMTTPVIAVRAETPLKDVAALLAARGVSGVPVVNDDRRVLGVVSETDIVVRVRGAGRERFDLLAWVSEYEGVQLEQKLHARTAADAMSHPAITIDADAPVAKAAAYIVDRGVSRLPVVDDQRKLVGIVSRANLVRAFARSDEEIEREIEHDVIPGPFLWCSPGCVQAAVEKGDVVLTGTVESEDVAQLLVSSVEHVLGVLSVRSELQVRGSLAVPD